MFTCINCTKQTEQEEEAHNGTPRTRDVRSLTAQFRDMASKVSGSYKHLIRPCVGSSSTSEEVQYPYMAGVGSSPTPDDWDLESAPSNTPGGRFDQAIMEGIGGDQTPRSVHESSPVGEIVEEEHQGLLEEEYEGSDPDEWIAQVEPGVNIFLVPLTEGGNELKRIRFSRSIFSRREAQRWWLENYDKVNELYNVRRISRLNPPPGIDTIEEEPAAESSPPPLASTRRSSLSSSFKEWAEQGFLDELAETEEGNTSAEPSHESDAQQFQAGSSSAMQAPNTTAGSGDNHTVTAVSNESAVETEWVEQDELGVLVTVRQLENGTKEIRRVRFSRQVFGEQDAKDWWEANRARVHAQYL